jgi:DNA-binding LytR/AlgR family response regulator
MAQVKREQTIRQAQGDERQVRRDESIAAVTSGAPAGISGEERTALLTYWLIGITIAGSICLFDVLTKRHDLPTQNPLNAVISEGSSWLMLVLVLAIPAAVVMWVRRIRPAAWQATLVHALAAIAYSMIHVAGFVMLRKIGFRLLVHQHYHFGPLVSEFFYEFGKDGVSYGMAALGCWLILRWRSGPMTPLPPTIPDCFDIRDGARLIRTPIAEILAVRSAGNYAEFLLSDGRRPMVRSALGALQTDLVPRGFLRTHRSWLINAARVTGLRPAGSGDYTVELGALEAPLSRRFKDALEVLRA